MNTWGELITSKWLNLNVFLMNSLRILISAVVGFISVIFVHIIISTVQESAYDEFAFGAGFIFSIICSLVATAFVKDKDEIRRLYEEVKQKSNIDPITDTYSLHFLPEAIKIITKQAARTESYILCIVMDLDSFKIINDTYGHTAGDAALRAFTENARSVFRNSDYLVRIHGDEFVLLAAHEDNPFEYCKKLISLLQPFEMKYETEEGEIEITISCSWGQHYGKIPEEIRKYSISNEFAEKFYKGLFDLADAKMYEMKKRKNETKEKSSKAKQVTAT